MIAVVYINHAIVSNSCRLVTVYLSVLSRLSMLDVDLAILLYNIERRLRWFT